ncbi:MAG TPA: tail fiber domain-containing protein [Moheibacter sp.]|nr:tail fiber domain-containing protein [Moheibacter sp.]
MKKYALLLVASFAANLAFSQVGIGTNTPNPNALLELDAADFKGGLILPRLALTSTTAAAPLLEHVEGMILYNTATTTGQDSIAPGFYYNDGSHWRKIQTKQGDPPNAWTTRGNAGTNPSRHFIGTTDEQALVFKVDNRLVGYLTPLNEGNLFLGDNAGYSNVQNNDSVAVKNIGIGELALFSNTTGRHNYASGSYAMQANTTGNENTASGSSALHNNTTGNNNTSLGHKALYNNTTGNDNTAIGYAALYTTTTRSNSTAMGSYALYSNTTGDNNTAAGYKALYNNTTGNNNTAMGYAALQNNTTGNNNTAIGFSANEQTITGNDNTAIGAHAGPLYSDLNNTTAIGYNAKVDMSDKVRLGNSNVKFIEAMVGWSVPSDARFKNNVQQNVPGLAFIKQLNPVTYYFDNQQLGQLLKEKPDENPITLPKETKTGFIAQEVEKAAQTIQYDFDGIAAPNSPENYYSLSYSLFVVPLVQTVKEQQEIILAQQNAMKTQEEWLNNQHLKSNTLEMKVKKQKETMQAQQALLKTLQNQMTAWETKMDL